MVNEKIAIAVREELSPTVNGNMLVIAVSANTTAIVTGISILSILRNTATKASVVPQQSVICY